MREKDRQGCSSCLAGSDSIRFCSAQCGREAHVPSWLQKEAGAAFPQVSLDLLQGLRDSSIRRISSAETLSGNHSASVGAPQQLSLVRLGSLNGDNRTKLWVPAGQSIQELRPLSRDQEPGPCALPTSFTLPGLHPISQSLCYRPVQLFLSPAPSVTSKRLWESPRISFKRGRWHGQAKLSFLLNTESGNPEQVQ